MEERFLERHAIYSPCVFPHLLAILFWPAARFLRRLTGIDHITAIPYPLASGWLQPMVALVVDLRDYGSVGWPEVSRLTTLKSCLCSRQPPFSRDWGGYLNTKVKRWWEARFFLSGLINFLKKYCIEECHFLIIL